MQTGVSLNNLDIYKQMTQIDPIIRHFNLMEEMAQNQELEELSNQRPKRSKKGKNDLLRPLTTVQIIQCFQGLIC